MLKTISKVFDACEDTEKKGLSLRTLARMSWIADISTLDAEHGVQVRIYDDQDVMTVIEMLRDGEGWCRMVIGP